MVRKFEEPPSTASLCLTAVLGMPAVPESSSAMHQKGKTCLGAHTAPAFYATLTYTEKKGSSVKEAFRGQTL